MVKKKEEKKREIKLQDCVKLLFSSSITAEFLIVATWCCDDFKLTGTLELQSNDGAVSGKSGIVVLLEFIMLRISFLTSDSLFVSSDLTVSKSEIEAKTVLLRQLSV